MSRATAATTAQPKSKLYHGRKSPKPSLQMPCGYLVNLPSISGLGTANTCASSCSALKPGTPEVSEPFDDAGCAEQDRAQLLLGFSAKRWKLGLGF